MMIIVNRKAREVPEGTTIGGLMKQLRLHGYYALLNFQPVSGGEYDSYCLQEGDDVRFVRMEAL